MAEPVVRRRNEGRVLRPFRGLENFDLFVAGAQLLVNTARGPKKYSMGDPVSGPGRLLVTAEIKIDFGATAEQLLDVAEPLGIPADAVSLVVMARDVGSSPLKETVVVSVIPLKELDRPVTLCELGSADRPRPMSNRHDGFGIVIQFVLNSDLPPRPLAPYLMGTILSGGGWDVISTDARSGIQPRPLTQEVRNRNLLPSAVWFYVEKIDSYLDAPNLQEAFTIYVDEQYLRNLAFLPPSARRMAEHMFIIPALVSVLMEATSELRSLPDDGPRPERTASPVLAFLHQKISEVSSDGMNFTDFVDLMRSDPGRMAGLITGTNGIRKKLIDVSESMAGGDE